LDRFYVNFANQNRPREENESVLSYRGHSAQKIEAAALYSDVSTQFFTQRYQETMLNTGQFGRAGGCETFEDGWTVEHITTGSGHVMEPTFRLVSMSLSSSDPISMTMSKPDPISRCLNVC
jgi:hypothetical protein